MNRRQFLQLTATGLMMAGCGSSQDTLTGPESSSPVAPIRGRGGRRATAEHMANTIKALDPSVLQTGVRSRVSLATSLPTSTRLPAAVIPPVQDQGVLESCGGFGIGYCMASSMAAITNPGLDLTSLANESSAAWMYKTAYTAEGYTTCLADQSDGTYAVNYFNQLISGGGSTTWAQVGYPSASLDETAMCNAIDQIVLASAPLDARFQLGSYQSVSDLATIKSYLAAGIPVAFLTELYANFDDFYDQGEDAVFGGTGQPNNGGHFMCLLGYDDSRGENGAFYAQNSWGTSFGYQGRYWFGYKTFMAALYEAYVPTAVTQGGTGTPLTPAASGGGGGRVTNAYQATAPDGRTHLITHLELDQATQLTVMHLQGPSGSRVSFRHSLPFRSGYLYVSREDGLSFRQGTYQLELETSSGQRLSAPLSIASLPGVAEGDLGLGVTGSTGRAASLD